MNVAFARSIVERYGFYENGPPPYFVESLGSRFFLWASHVFALRYLRYKQSVGLKRVFPLRLTHDFCTHVCCLSVSAVHFCRLARAAHRFLGSQCYRRHFADACSVFSEWTHVRAKYRHGKGFRKTRSSRLAPRLEEAHHREACQFRCRGGRGASVWPMEHCRSVFPRKIL